MHCSSSARYTLHTQCTVTPRPPARRAAPPPNKMYSGRQRGGSHGQAITATASHETTVINALLRRSFISRTQTRQTRVLTPCSHAIPHNHKFRTYNLLLLYVAIIMLEITISSRTHPHSPPTFADLLYLWNNTLRTIDSTPYGSSFVCLSVRRILS